MKYNNNIYYTVIFFTIFSTIGLTIKITQNAIGVTFTNAFIQKFTKLSGNPIFISVTIPLIKNPIIIDIITPPSNGAYFFCIFFIGFLW